MAIDPEVKQRIRDNMGSPLEAEVDGVQARRERSLDELRAERLACNMDAVDSMKGIGIKISRIVPPGAR